MLEKKWVVYIKNFYIIENKKKKKYVMIKGDDYFFFMTPILKYIVYIII